RDDEADAAGPCRNDVHDWQELDRECRQEREPSGQVVSTTATRSSPELTNGDTPPCTPDERAPRYPALYQMNTRLTLAELGDRLGRPAPLDDVPDATLDRLAANKFDWIWLLGIWQTGDAGRQVSLTQPEWLREYRELIPDFTPDDVCGSPFAV